MTKNELIDYIKHGREIVFKYDDHKYSITYSPDGEEDYISFCEFYKNPINVKNTEELMQIKINEITVMQMLERITENDIWIY